MILDSTRCTAIRGVHIISDIQHVINEALEDLQEAVEVGAVLHYCISTVHPFLPRDAL